MGVGRSAPGIIFGIFWTAFSSIFVVVGLWISYKEGKVQGWDEVPCMVEKFEITATRKDDPPFRPEVVFTYDHAGSSREGTKLWREKKGVDDYEDLAKLREKLWSSSLDTTCRVNPDDPDEAVLIMDQANIWGGLAFAAFGGGFVLVGIGLIVASIKGRKAAKAVSAKKESEMGGLLGCGFFGIFAVAGLGIMFGLVMPTALAYFKMRSWVETPAEVIWSRVQSHSSDDGTTYSADVFYKFQVGDREYRSNRWNVMGGSSSGRSAKQEVVDAHPPGRSFICYVDPDEPWRAVVNRKLGWWGLFALFPLPFIAVGVGGLWYTFVRKPGKTGSTKSGSELRIDGQASSLRSEEKQEAKSRGRRKRIHALIGALVLAVFWNGIVSVFVGVAWKGWQRGQPEWFLILFMIPFVLIGVFLLLHVPYRLLAIFSPIYDLAVADDDMAPGDRVRVSWKRSGGGGQPRKLSIWLVGQEEATYRRGSNTSTASSVFHEACLFETETPRMMPAGTCDMLIPEDAVPSFHGEHNKVRWFIRLIADVPWRPDVSDEHVLEVGNPNGSER